MSAELANSNACEVLLASGLQMASVALPETFVRSSDLDFSFCSFSHVPLRKLAWCVSVSVWGTVMLD